MRIRYLRLHAETDAGPYGADVPFDVGLNVLWADNTKGKSTCLQGLLYALGLERMLSPRREIPLPYVMTSHLDDPDKGTTRKVLESFVFVELQNNAGEIVTVRRAVKAEADTKLVSVFNGPLLSQPSANYRQRDYFVLDPGAAQREAGFHRFLAEFLGWTLPTVKRFDGGEAKLYLETIFPLLYVEQKAGWSFIPAAFPSYFQIRDVGRRSVEFLLGLDTHSVELEKQRLDIDLINSRASWGAKRDEAISIGQRIMAKVEGIGATPIVAASEVEKAYLSVLEGENWKPIDEILSILRAQFRELQQIVPPPVSETEAKTAEEIDRLTTQLHEINSRRNSIFRARQVEVSQSLSIKRRLTALEDDLTKNLDAQKLRDLGSSISKTYETEHCPTCSQPITDTLLVQVGAPVLPLEDNINYIRAQIAIFRRQKAQSDDVLSFIDKQLVETGGEVTDISARLRALKTDLISPSHATSALGVERRVRLEARIKLLEDTQLQFEQLKAALIQIGKRYGELTKAYNDLPKERHSKADKDKLEKFNELVRQHAEAYGFSTFPAREIEISEENYRPHKEGFEIGFELSASDTIRLKWAYQLALMELARSKSSNHPGFVVFDEPRQQETAKVSFQKLLERASETKAANQQVIFATSEDRAQLESFLQGVDCHLISFDGAIVHRL